jgi:hypothetical protein
LESELLIKLPKFMKQSLATVVTVSLFKEFAISAAYVLISIFVKNAKLKKAMLIPSSKLEDQNMLQFSLIANTNKTINQ